MQVEEKRLRCFCRSSDANESITSGAGLGTGGPALQGPLVRVLLDDVVVVDGHRVFVDDVLVHQSGPRLIVPGDDLRAEHSKQTREPNLLIIVLRTAYLHLYSPKVN